MGLTRRRAVWENMRIGSASALGDEGHASRKGQEFDLDKNLMDKQCVYCVNAKAETWDHVPPRGIFATDNRGDLIRVPACFNCNNEFSKDDEWMMHVLAKSPDSRQHPQIGDVPERSTKSLMRPKHQKMSQQFTASELWDPIGKKIIGMKIIGEKARVKSILSRYVRGLFYHNYHRVLPVRYTVYCRLWDDLYDWQKRRVNQKLVGITMNHVRSGRGAFEYKTTSASDSPDASIWRMRFYQGSSLEAIAWTVPQERLDALATAE